MYALYLCSTTHTLTLVKYPYSHLSGRYLTEQEYLGISEDLYFGCITILRIIDTYVQGVIKHSAQTLVSSHILSLLWISIVQKFLLSVT